MMNEPSPHISQTVQGFGYENDPSYHTRNEHFIKRHRAANHHRDDFGGIKKTGTSSLIVKLMTMTVILI